MRKNQDQDLGAELAAAPTIPDVAESVPASEYEALRLKYEAALDALVQTTGYLKNAFADADRANRGRDRWATRKLWDIISEGSDDAPPWDDLSTAADWCRERLAATKGAPSGIASTAASPAPESSSQSNNVRTGARP